MKKASIAVFLAFWAAGLMAQSITLDYVDGAVDLRTAANTWKPAVEGTKFGPEAVLRVSGGGAAELTAPTSKIHLAKDGIYQLKDLLAVAKPTDKNVASLASKALDRLMTGKIGGKSEVANMGVRADQANASQVTWAGDDDSTVAPLSALAKARSLASQGRPAAALKVLRDGKLKSTDPEYLASLVLTSTQALEVQDADLVLSSSALALATSVDQETKQTLLLTQALAYRLQSNPAKAKDLLNEVVKVDPASALGQEAKRQLTL